MLLFRDKRLILTGTIFITSFEMSLLMSQLEMYICTKICPQFKEMMDETVRDWIDILI